MKAGGGVRAFVRLLGAAAVLLAFSAGARAQDYPNRPVRLIIPFPPGGSNDVVGRAIANGLGEKLGQRVFVDNRGGAGGVIGTEAAAKSEPDGYTLLIVSLAHAVNPALYKLSYDPVKSFVPIGMLAVGPNVLAVHPALPVKSVQELIDLAKQKPGSLNYASAGSGSFQHLGGELFKQMAGVQIQHVPYKGGGPAMLDVISGQVGMIFSSLIQTKPLIDSGQLRTLATGGLKRSPVLPDVPTLAEAGVPGYEANNWWGMLAPAGLPGPTAALLQRSLRGVLRSPELQQQFAREGAAVTELTPAQFQDYMEAEIAKWGRVVKQGGINP